MVRDLFAGMSRMAVGAMVAAPITAVSGRQCEPAWLSQPPGAALDNTPLCFEAFQGELVVGGYFTKSGAQTLNRVARWTGTTWAPLGAGVSGSPSPPSPPRVYALAEFQSALIAGGAFQFAGGASAPSIARWDGQEWTSVGGGTSGEVRALLAHQKHLVAAGSFTAVGGASALSIASWDGASWSGMGPGLNNIVFSIAGFGPSVVAGGAFSHAGATQVNGIALWSGTTWLPLGNGLASGFESWVAEVAVWREDLYALAIPSLAGGRLYRWNGSWWALVAGFEGQAPGFPSLPEQLTVFGDELIVGGNFTGAGGIPIVPAANIVRWNGSTFNQLGSGVNFDVHATKPYNDNLVVGGIFSMAGGQPAPFWARWGCSCYPDCNNDTQLTVADFGCFQTQFVAAHPYADCNHDGALTVQDFGCFQTKFVTGCP